MKSTLFISSVQKGLQVERCAIADFVQGDPLLRRYFDAFLFEDLPATDRRADEVYLDEVDRSAIYVGLFGDEYGAEDADGLSATEREFDRATQQGKFRLIFVKGADDKARHPKMLKLIRKASRQLIRRRFAGTHDLTAQLYASLVQHLEEKGLLRTVPFDAAACRGASSQDISDEKLRWFLGAARRERQYVLRENTPLVKALAHLNLLHDGQPTHAAILLFGQTPQRFVVSAEIKCLHFHGTEVRKPIPSYHIYKGTVFDLVDQAVDFVMSKLARSVGTRELGPQAPVEYELPREAVMEAIVNAVAHRDYDSNAAVQVMLFADRLEVWNPGELPPGLTPDLLRIEHPSIPRNPLICEPMFLAHYAEKAGSGTLDMIARCQQTGLPAPDFEQRGSQFVTTIWRDWLTAPALSRLSLNDRQRAAVRFVRVNRRIGNLDYQKLTGAIKKTASRDLDDLVRRGVFEKVGTTGRGTCYVLAKKGDIKGTKGTSRKSIPKGTERGQRRRGR
ncbi:MAG TPA: ATP-binding protein [Planctomycetota bacterium]|nr:ATP-binding protein [Planctomycetota bacterium]